LSQKDVQISFLLGITRIEKEKVKGPHTTKVVGVNVVSLCRYR